MIGGSNVADIIESKNLDDQRLLKEFLAIVKSLIVYRSSPAQKAKIVQCMRKIVPDAYTLSIGDGANDVNMIQSAHVGIGIYGKEGEQAASFSDYALPEFKHLRRLLFVHGRSVGVKTTNFLAWYTYKSLLYSIISMFMNIHNGFSGVSYFIDYYLALYDVNLSTFAMLGYVLFDQDIKFSDPVLPNTTLPKYYAYCRDEILNKAV